MKAILLLSLLFFNGNAEIPEILTQARKAISQGLPLRAHFVQQALIDGEVELQEEGGILIADPDRIKMSYLDPEQKTLVIDRTDYLFYQPELNQAIRGKIGWAIQETIWQVLFADHPVSTVESDGDRQKLLVRMTESSRELNFEVSFDADFLPSKVRQFDDSGLETIFIFSSYILRVKLQPDDLSLSLPEGTEIIEQDEEYN